MIFTDIAPFPRERGWGEVDDTELGRGVGVKATESSEELQRSTELKQIIILRNECSEIDICLDNRNIFYYNLFPGNMLYMAPGSAIRQRTKGNALDVDIPVVPDFDDDSDMEN